MDDSVTTVLRRAVAGIDVPTGDLVAAGVAGGRRRRRVRRVVEVTSGAAVLAAVVALVVVALPGDRRTATVGAADTGGPSASSPQSSPSDAPDTVAVTPQSLLRTALDTLPRPGASSRYAGNFSSGWTSTQFVWDDGQGASAIYVAISYDGTSDGQVCVPGQDGCTALPDGARVKYVQSREYGPGDPRQPNATERSLYLFRPDGVVLSVLEFNAPQEKDAALTRDVPPFGRAELVAWLDRPVWTTQITRDRADATAGLFTPVDLDAPEPGATTSAPAPTCAQARAKHVTPPANCR